MSDWHNHQDWHNHHGLGNVGLGHSSQVDKSFKVASLLFLGLFYLSGRSSASCSYRCLRDRGRSMGRWTLAFFLIALCWLNCYSFSFICFIAFLNCAISRLTYLVILRFRLLTASIPHSIAPFLLRVFCAFLAPLPTLSSFRSTFNLQFFLIFASLGVISNVTGTGAVYSFDPVGSYEREACRAAGSASSLVQPFLDNQVSCSFLFAHMNMSADQSTLLLSSISKSIYWILNQRRTFTNRLYTHAPCTRPYMSHLRVHRNRPYYSIWLAQ